MKRIIMKYGLILAFAVGFIATACEENSIDIDAGVFPETGGIGLSMGILQSNNYAMENPLINMDHADANDEFHINLTEPALQTGNYTAKIDESKVADFNAKYGTSYPLYPTAFVTFKNEGKMTIEKGKQQSNSIPISFKNDASIAESVIYVLPLTVEENGSSPSVSAERKTIYYVINVWGIAPAEYIASKKDFIQIAGIDPEYTNPLLINKLYMEDSEPPIGYYNPFDIVNLQFATVKVDNNHLPSLFLKDDLAYVLEKREKYIVPLQQLGHQVCLAIKGGGEGIGFSNLREKELKIFIERIKQTIDLYHLDGVNLYDIDFLYKKTDNKFDYSENLCIFTSSLRKELGSKIITYTQTAESPEGIMDNTAGLKLGELVDYAWTNRLNTIINPWGSSDIGITPIAGITKEKWGALNSDIHMSGEESNTLTEAALFGEMKDAEMNHVFVVERVDYVTVGLEGYAPIYMAFGGISNLSDLFGTGNFVGGINSPNGNQYLDIHNPLMPKDY